MTQTNAEQSQSAAPATRRRVSPASIGGALILIGVGAVLLVSSLLHRGATWEWSTKTLSDLDGAKINATLEGTTSNGVKLARQGGRAVSLITRPLSLPDDVGRTVEVVASIPGATKATDQTVVFLWQTEEAEGYHFDKTQARLGPKPTTVRFSLSVPANELHRFGFQFPDATDDVVISQMGFPSLGIGQRLALAWSQAEKREPFDSYSINFLRGPSILGTSVNADLAGLLALAVGVVWLAVSVLRKRLRIAVVVAVVVAVWAIEDARATWNLDRNARDERAQFEKIDQRADRWAAAQGNYELAWAADLLEKNAHPGSTYCVISDDTFMVPHRLDYLVVPKLVKIDDCHHADFIVVLFSSDADYDADKQILTLPDKSTVSARPVAQLTNYAYILHNNGSKAE